MKNRKKEKFESMLLTSTLKTATTNKQKKKKKKKKKTNEKIKRKKKNKTVSCRIYLRRLDRGERGTRLPLHRFCLAAVRVWDPVQSQGEVRSPALHFSQVPLEIVEEER